MIETRFKLAKVIDNNDIDKLGRVKVLIYDIDDINENTNNLKWAWSSRAKNDIPEIDDVIWVRLVDQQMRKIFYGSKLSFKNINMFSEFDDNIKSKITGWESSYPNVKFDILQNGNCIAMSSINGEMALVNSEGAYVFLTKEGNIDINGTVDNAVRYSILETAYNTLKKDLNTFITLYGTHIHLVTTPDTINGTAAVTTMVGTPSVGDISGAKVDNVKLP